MIAHCMFHQMPAPERCHDCGHELTLASGRSYCAWCLVERRKRECPICVASPPDSLAVPSLME